MRNGEGVIGTFNNNDLKSVAEIKCTAARLVDQILEHGQNGRHNSIAITHVETAAMFAVKSVFTPDAEVDST